MDFHSMKRKQLQALCKKHKIPANLSNIELANRLIEFLKERENPVIKEQEENVSEIECNDEVLNKKGKKVRFSPEHELIEFTKSLAIRRRSRRHSVFSSDSNRSVEIVESGERNKETVGRRGSAIRTGESNLMDAEVKQNKRKGKAVNGTAKGDEKTSDNVKNEEIVNNDCRVTRSRAQKLTEAPVEEEKMGRKVVKNIGKVAVVRAETDDGRGGTSTDSSSKRGDDGGEKSALGLDKRIKGNGKGLKETKQSAGACLTVKPQLPLRRSKRKSNVESENDEVDGPRKTSKLLTSDGSNVDVEISETEVKPSKRAVLKVEENVQKMEPRRSNRRKTLLGSAMFTNDARNHEKDEVEAPRKTSKMLASDGTQVEAEISEIEVYPSKRTVLKVEETVQKMEPRRSNRRKTMIASAMFTNDASKRENDEVVAPRKTSKMLASDGSQVVTELGEIQVNPNKNAVLKIVGENTRPRRNTAKGKPLGPLEKVAGDSSIQENKVMKRKRGHVSGGETNNDLNSGAQSLKGSSSKKVVVAVATREFADDRKQPHTIDHPNSTHRSSGTGESLFVDVQLSVSKDSKSASNLYSRNITDVELRESHKEKEEVSFAYGAVSSSMNFTNGEDLMNSDTNAASKTAEKGTNTSVTDDQKFTSKAVEVESSKLALEVAAVESIEKNIADVDKNDNEAQVYRQMEDSGCNNKVLAEGLNVSGEEGSAETCSSGYSFLLCDEIDVENLKVAEAEADDHHHNLEASINVLDNNNEDTSQTFGEDGASESCSMTRHHGDDVAEGRATELAEADADACLKDNRNGEKYAICSNSTDVNLERNHEDDQITKKEERSMYAETRESESSKGRKSKCDKDGEFRLTKLFDEEGMYTPQDKENLSDEHSDKQGMSHGSPSVLVCNSAGDHEANLLLSAEGAETYNIHNKQSELTEADESGCLTSYKKSSNSQEINPSTPSETQANTEADELVQPCLTVVDPNNDLEASSNILDNKNEDTSQTFGEDGAFESHGMTMHHVDNVAEGSETSFPKGRTLELDEADEDGCSKHHGDASDHFSAFDMPDQFYGERDTRIVLPDREIIADSTDVNLKRDHEDDQMTKTEERYMHGVAESHESDSSKGLKSKCNEDGVFSLTELFEEDGRYGFTPQEKENLSGGHSVKDCNEQGKAHCSPSILTTMCNNSAGDHQANLSLLVLTAADESGSLKTHTSSNSQETNPSTPLSVSETQEKQKSLLAKSNALASSNQKQGAWSNASELAGNAVWFLKSSVENISQVPEAISADEDDKEASAKATISDVQSCLISKIAAESLGDVKSQDSVENAYRHKNLLTRQTNAGDEAVHATSRQSWTETDLQNLFETLSEDNHPGVGDTFYQGSVTANMTCSKNKLTASDSGSLTEKQDREMDADIYENEFKVLFATPVKNMTPCKIVEAYSHDRVFDGSVTCVTSIKGCSNAMKENLDTESTSCEKTRSAGYEVENNSSIGASLSDNGGDDICEEINEVKSFELLNTSTRVLSEAEYDGCEALVDQLNQNKEECLQENNSITEEDREEHVIPHMLETGSCKSKAYNKSEGEWTQSTEVELSDNDNKKSDVFENRHLTGDKKSQDGGREDNCGKMDDVESEPLKYTSTTITVLSETGFHGCEASRGQLTEITRECQEETNFMTEDNEEKVVPQSCLFYEEIDNYSESTEENCFSATQNNLDKPEGCQDMLIDSAMAESPSCKTSVDHKSEQEMIQSSEAAVEISDADLQKSIISKNSQDVTDDDTYLLLSPKASTVFNALTQCTNSDDLDGAKICDEIHSKSQDMTDESHIKSEVASWKSLLDSDHQSEAGLACCLEHESTFVETKETGATSQDLSNIVATADYNSSVHNAESRVLSSSEMHLHLRDANSSINNLDVGKSVFSLSVDNDKMDSEKAQEISTAEMIQFSIQEFHSEEKKEHFTDDTPTISNQPASGYNGILMESDVADTINEYIDSESSISVMFENSSASHAANSKHEDNASSVDGLNTEIQEQEQATLLTRPVGFLDQGSTLKLESQKKIESEDGQNSSIELHSTMKSNARTILIHGTPGKLLSMADMKENTATQKRSNIGDITAVRPAKRKALQDLQLK